MKTNKIMTELKLNQWVKLTTESSKSSYGIPVVVATDPETKEETEVGACDLVYDEWGSTFCIREFMGGNKEETAFVNLFLTSNPHCSVRIDPLPECDSA